MPNKSIGTIIEEKWMCTWFYPEYLEKKLIKMSLWEAKDYAQGILLDVGCGKKPYLEMLMNPSLKMYVGLEYPLSFSKSAFLHGEKADIYGSGLQIPIKENAIDTVLCTQVLEHTCSPELMFKEFNRILKEGGYLILTAPQEWGIHREPYDYYRFTKYGLEYLAKNNGFEIIYIKSRGGFWVMIGQRLSAYFYEIFPGKLRKKGLRFLFIFSALFILPLCAIIQLTALGLDHLNRFERNTIGYIMVAQKVDNI